MFDLINQTGLSMVETDGPYGGQSCASDIHIHHAGYSDSIYWQNHLQGQFYSDLRQHNVFINQPDNYFFHGGSKTGMGYLEWQYSTPRWIDLTVARQTMFDDTYYHLPTQGWMIVPLIQYERGTHAHAHTYTTHVLYSELFCGANFREKPEMAFRNNFRDAVIRGDSGMCTHAQRGIDCTGDVL